jgi:hypothetical protein
MDIWTLNLNLEESATLPNILVTSLSPETDTVLNETREKVAWNLQLLLKTI